MSGDIGVSIFFMISPVVLTISLKQNPDYTQYLVKRAFRIFPIYYFNIAMIYIVYASLNILPIPRIFSMETLQILSLTQIYGTDPQFVNPVVWSINVEWSLYIIFPVIFILVEKRFYITLLFVAYIYLASVEAGKHVFHTYEFGKHIYSFVLGSAIAAFFSCNNDRHINMPKSLSFIVIIIMIFAFGYSYAINAMGLHKHLILTFFNCAIFILIALCNQKDCVYRFVFENRIAQFFGKISYSVYLFHFPVQFILVYYMNRSNFLQIVGESFVITIILSICTYYVVEKPFLKQAKKIYSPAKQVHGRSIKLGLIINAPPVNALRGGLSKKFNSHLTNFKKPVP